uniref:Calmodulin-lysine N-methyltransferase n=1 Tax=Lepisosteus oculatus TaxID=7918 RepID=W5NHW3_LEPOC
ADPRAPQLSLHFPTEPRKASDQRGTATKPDVARARWSLLSQVLKHKQLDNIEVQQVSVRRFSSFNLFTRTRVRDLEIEEPGDEMWFEYRSATFPQFRAFLRDNLGPIKVNEVLNSFDNTGNVC